MSKNYDIRVFETIDSTHLYAKTLVTERNTLIRALHQTQGVGKPGHRWFSEKNQLMCSFIFKEYIVDYRVIHHLSYVLAVAVHDYFTHLGARNLKIKWPNDLYDATETYKICGLLCDYEPHHLIMSIGANMTSTPADLNKQTTTLQEQGLSVHAFKTLDLYHHVDLHLRHYLQNGFEPFRTYWLTHAAYSLIIQPSKEHPSGRLKTIDQGGYPVIYESKDNTLPS